MKNFEKTNKQTNKQTKKNPKQATKNFLKIWLKVTFPPNLASICLTGSEKTGFTDGGTTDDGRPHEDSSCAVH